MKLAACGSMVKTGQLTVGKSVGGWYQVYIEPEQRMTGWSHVASFPASKEQYGFHINNRDFSWSPFLSDGHADRRQSH